MSVVEMEPPVSVEQVEPSAPPRELVVLVHGFAAPSWVMGRMAKRLEERGFETRQWTYSTFKGNLREHGCHLAEELDRLAEAEKIDKIHIVAHSMGSIVARIALRKLKQCKIAKVVLLAPPNRGVKWARWFEPIVKYLIPTVYDLSTSPESYVNQCPTPDNWYVGIIRADFDWIVPRYSVELSEQMDFAAFPTWHTGLLFRQDVAEAVGEFLKTGAFPTAGEE